MSMNIEEILEQLDDMLDTAWAMPYNTQRFFSLRLPFFSLLFRI